MSEDKQRISYRPQIDYTHDYESSGKTIQQEEVSISRNKKEPLDTQSIPSIGDSITYIDSVLAYLPSDLSRALREVYEPVRDIYFDSLIDKIVDPNPQKPGIEFKPGGGEDKTPSNMQDKIYPIVLYPLDFGNSKNPEDDNKSETKEEIYPIILESAKNKDDSEGDDIRAPHPIILNPIDKDNKDDGGGDDIWDDTGDDGLWDEPEIEVDYTEPDIGEAVDKEFVYLMTKLTKHYIDKLTDIINNYIYNALRYNLGQSEENMKFISNRLQINSNDIMNHSKHLFDSSIKNEDMTTLKTDFFKNIFNIKESRTHIRSFYLSHELRKRYTDIRYSKGKSMANSMSDIALKKTNINYELQYRKTFENLFRYLESSLKVTEDILRLHSESRMNKSTIIKKGGVR